MSKKWNYAWLTHLAKTLGGPEKFIAKLIAFGGFLGTFFASIGLWIRSKIRSRKMICKNCIYYNENMCTHTNPETATECKNYCSHWTRKKRRNKHDV